MTSWSRLALTAAFVAAIVLGAGRADAAVVFQLQLPLTDQAATNAAIAPYGGTISGGTFGPSGWTTTARSNIIVVPLPAGLDTQQGQMVFSVQSFEWNVTTQYWEQWALVGLDSFGPPLGQGSTGTGSVLTLYRGFNPSDATKGYHLVGYFNLFEPSCAAWQDCTAEAKTPHFWLQQSGQVYTATRAWQGQGETMTFSGTGTVTRTLDLSATSSGTINASQFYLMINACGGSTHNQCGPWDGPTNLKGGPIGVTYSDVTLEIYGPDPPDAGVADAGVADAEVADAATADAGLVPSDGAASTDASQDLDATRPDANAATDAETAPGVDAAPGDPGQVSGGCACRSGGSAPGGHLALAGLLLVVLLVRRRSASSK